MDRRSQFLQKTKRLSLQSCIKYKRGLCFFFCLQSRNGSSKKDQECNCQINPRVAIIITSCYMSLNLSDTKDMFLCSDKSCSNSCNQLFQGELTSFRTAVMSDDKLFPISFLPSVYHDKTFNKRTFSQEKKIYSGGN